MTNIEIDNFKDKTVLITGGTGSFGQAFIKKLLSDDLAKKIIVFSRDEYKQHKMKQEFNHPKLRFFLGDVRDETRLKIAFNQVDIVIHAAALKQVPALEYNPFEAVKTNIIGTQNVIEAAINRQVAKVVLISTDKAAAPVNLYGSTKLSAEKLFIASNAYSDQSSFSVVRYGNVIGSRGSIVENLLNRQKDNKVKITDPQMTRFWITLERAFALVSYALTKMIGGEVFIPKIPSMKIGDLFEVLAPQSEKEIIGIRPGEKMHEVLLTEHEATHSYDLGDYYVILPEFNFGRDYSGYLAEAQKLAPGFCYRSNENNLWLTPQELEEKIK